MCSSLTLWPCLVLTHPQRKSRGEANASPPLLWGTASFSVENQFSLCRLLPPGPFPGPLQGGGPLRAWSAACPPEKH